MAIDVDGFPSVGQLERARLRGAGTHHGLKRINDVGERLFCARRRYEGDVERSEVKGLRVRQHLSEKLIRLLMDGFQAGFLLFIGLREGPRILARLVPLICKIGELSEAEEVAQGVGSAEGNRQGGMPRLGAFGDLARFGQAPRCRQIEMGGEQLERR